MCFLSFQTTNPSSNVNEGYKLKKPNITKKSKKDSESHKLKVLFVAFYCSIKTLFSDRFSRYSTKRWVVKSLLDAGHFLPRWLERCSKFSCCNCKFPMISPSNSSASPRSQDGSTKPKCSLMDGISCRL